MDEAKKCPCCDNQLMYMIPRIGTPAGYVCTSAGCLFRCNAGDYEMLCKTMEAQAELDALKPAVIPVVERKTMRIFELRACWSEYYDCPDNGRTFVCDTYDTVAFEINGTNNLTAIADDLAKGFNNGPWSESRAKALRKLYPVYDDFRDTTYEIVEVTGLIVDVKSELEMEDECRK